MQADDGGSARPRGLQRALRRLSHRPRRPRRRRPPPRRLSRRRSSRRSLPTYLGG